MTTGTWKLLGRNVIVCLDSQDHRRQQKGGHAEVEARRAGERNSSGGSPRTGRMETCWSLETGFALERGGERDCKVSRLQHRKHKSSGLSWKRKISVCAVLLERHHNG